jgi:hypothetical protein
MITVGKNASQTMGGVGAGKMRRSLIVIQSEIFFSVFNILRKKLRKKNSHEAIRGP